MYDLVQDHFLSINLNYSTEIYGETKKSKVKYSFHIM